MKDRLLALAAAEPDRRRRLNLVREYLQAYLLRSLQDAGAFASLAFQGGNEAQNATIAERIADGTQGLCFASPEAACGTLRTSLRRAADVC